MLAAGLEGIEKNYVLQDPIERNVYEMSESQRRELGIESLPEDLYEAIKLTEQSELVRRTLGDHVFYKLLENKKLEWERYRAQVTTWEMEEYFENL